MLRSGIGDAPKRREDQRFLTGQGAISTTSPSRAGACGGAALAARACPIDASMPAAARAMPGVLAVLTAAEARADGLQPLRPMSTPIPCNRRAFAFAPQPLLAEDKVRYVGEPVALVVAETRDAGARRRRACRDRLRAAAGGHRPAGGPRPRRAADRGRSPRQSVLRLADRRPRGGRRRLRGGGACRSLSLDNHRVVTNPMEPRGVVGPYDPASGRYTAYVSGQSIHATRDHAARALGVARGLRFVAPDVGGGFGAKNFVYPEHVLHALGGEAGRPSGQMDRRPRRGLSRRPPGARPPGRGGAGARRRGPVPGAAHRQQRQSRRLSRRAAAAGCRPSSTPSAGHGVPHPGDRAAGRRRLHQYRAVRRLARPRLCRDGQHRRAADRPRRRGDRLRPRRICAAATWCRRRRCR